MSLRERGSSDGESEWYRDYVRWILKGRVRLYMVIEGGCKMMRRCHVRWDQGGENNFSDPSFIVKGR
jgi:hypothetical protein